MNDRQQRSDTLPSFPEPDTQVDATDPSRTNTDEVTGGDDTDQTHLEHDIADEVTGAREPATWPKSVITMPFARGKRGHERAQIPVRLDARKNSSAPFDRPGVGQRYLNYEIRRRLARGSMGVVYEASHLHLDRRVAIKFLSPALLSDKGIVLRFLGEARAMARINHPGVPRVHDFGQDEAGNAYLVMDYLDGESLADRIDRGPLALAAALEIAAQVAEVLAAAHEQDIVHRDLKPENIILCRQQPTDGDGGDLRPRTRVRLIDFGICKSSWDTRDDTVAGNLIGTPLYMAPEQTTSETLTARTDVYALGCVLYELIAHEPPFSGSIAELVDAHRHRAPPDVREKRRETPAALADLIASMLAKKPAARPSSGSELARSLRSAARSARAVDAPPTRSSGDDGPPTPVRRRTAPPPIPRATTARRAIERGMLGPGITPLPFHPPESLEPRGSVDIRLPSILMPAASCTTQLTIAPRKSAVFLFVLACAVAFVAFGLSVIAAMAV